MSKPKKDFSVTAAHPSARGKQPLLQASSSACVRGRGQHQSHAVTFSRYHHSGHTTPVMVKWLSFFLVCFVLLFKSFSYRLHLSKHCFLITEVSGKYSEAGEKKVNRLFKYWQPRLGEKSHAMLKISLELSVTSLMIFVIPERVSVQCFVPKWCPSFGEFKILSVCLARVKSPELSSRVAAESESYLAEW